MNAALVGKRILVTGANGFIGRALLFKLLACGLDAKGHYRTTTQAPTTAHDSVASDLADFPETMRALKAWAPEVVFHLAGAADGSESLEHSQNCISSNLAATANLLEAFRRIGGEIFVYGDSSKSYGNSSVPYTARSVGMPNSSYAISKSAGWSFCQLFARQHGFSTVSVRPTLVFGPGQNFNLITYVYTRVRGGIRDIELLGGEQTRDPLYIDDAVDAYIASASPTNNHRTINIGGGSERTVETIALEVAKVMGIGISVRCNSTSMRSTEIMNSYCDNLEALAWLGWEPVVPFIAGLQRTVDFLNAKHTKLD